jgi:hypothetical protein
MDFRIVPKKLYSFGSINMKFPLRLDYGRSPHAYVNQRMQRESSWWWAVCRSKHVEPLMNGGIINSITKTAVPTQTWLRPVTICVCKPEAAKTELLMMSGVPFETCWAFNERWNNTFYYKVASCWLFILSHTTMHGSMDIRKKNSYLYSGNERIIPNSCRHKWHREPSQWPTVCEEHDRWMLNKS